MKRTRLPIADPCHEDWDAMSPTARGRFCQQCTKQVYDLSSMTERKAENVITENAGARICVRYRCDTSGNIKFRPEQTAAAAAVLALAMVACTPHDNPRIERGQPADRIEQTEDVVVGELEVVDTPPVQEIEVKGEVPIEEVEELMGDVAAPNPPDEPCDKPPSTEDEGERDRVLMGKPAIHPREPDPLEGLPEAEAEPEEEWLGNALPESKGEPEPEPEAEPKAEPLMGLIAPVD